MRLVRRRSWADGCVCWGVAWGLCASTADAHPFGDRYAAQRLDVAVQADHLDVVWKADAPRALLPQTAEGIDVPRMHAELPAGLVATLDGTTLTPTEVEVVELPELTTEHGVGVEVRLRYEADLRGAHALTVSNGNLQGTPSFHLLDATLPAGIDVVSSSLWAEPQGLRKIDLSDRWSRAESRRRFALSWAWPSSPWDRLWDALHPPMRHLSSLHPQPAWLAWWTGQETPPTFAVAVVGQFVLGVLLGWSPAAQRTGAFAAACALAAIVWGAPGAGGSLIGIALAAGVDPRVAVALAAASWGRPWSPVLVGAAAFGLLAGRGAEPAPRRRVLAGLALAAALATHGVGAPPAIPTGTPDAAPTSTP
jgi:hypothetical protein